MNAVNIVNLVLISCSVLFAGISLSLLAPFYPSEALSKGVSVTESGLVLGSLFITTIIVTPIFGKYIEIIGCRKFLIVGSFLIGLGNFLFGFIGQVEDKTIFFILSIVIRVITAIGESAVAPASIPLVSKQVSKENQGKAIAVSEACFGIGTMFGPTLGGALYDLYGFPMPFWVSGSMMLIVTLVSMFYLKDVESVVDDARVQRKVSWMEIVRTPGVLISAFSLTFAGTGWSWYSASLEPFLYAEYGLTSAQTGLVFMAFGLSYTVFTPVFGVFNDRGLDGLLTILIGNTLISLGFTFLGPVPAFNFLGGNLWLTVLSIVVQGVGSAATFLATLLYMIRSTMDAGLPQSEQVKSMVSSIWVLADCAGGVLGSAVGSIAFDMLGFQRGSVVITLTMVGTVVGIAVYFFHQRSTVRATQSSESTNNVEEEQRQLLIENKEEQKYGAC